MKLSRIGSLLLAMLMLATLFAAVSCAGTGDNESFDMDFDSSESYQIDFGGRTFLAGLRSMDVVDVVIPIEENISVSADATRKHIAKVEQALNCKLEQKVWAGASMVLAQYASGGAECDYYFLASFDEYSMYKSGLIWNLGEISAIDLTDENKWGTQAILNPLSFKNDIFGVYPYAWSTGLSGAEGAMICNDNLIASFSQTHPRELYENGQWTFDTFLDYLPKVADITGDNPIYGITIYPGQLCQLYIDALFANGGEFIKNVNGTYTWGLEDPNATAAFEWAKQVWDTGLCRLESGREAELFSSNQATFWLGGSWVAIDTREGYPLTSLEKFSWVQFPFGPSGIYGESISAFNFANMGIAISSDRDGEEVGTFIDMLYSEREDLSLADNMSLTARQFFFTEDDYQTALALTKQMADTHLYTELGSVRDTILNSINSYVQGSKSLTESIAAIKDKVLDAIDTELNS